MRGASKNQIMRGLVPWAATILSMSLAVTLRVEHACSGAVSPAPTITPSLQYPYAEFMTAMKLD